MAVFKPFRAVRPEADFASSVAALPYDVMNTEEARIMAAGNPLSFLHIDRAEIDFEPGTDPYAPAIYEKAAENLRALSDKGVCVQEEEPVYFIYRQIMDGRAQYGIVGCASVDDYLCNIIRKHELTRADKEEDRVRHVDVCDANTGPIFLTYRKMPAISILTHTWAETHDALYDFTAEDGIRHSVWRVDDPEVIENLEAAFAAVPVTYIADGHHRAASAVRVAKMRRAAHPDYDGTEEFNYFLAVLFPSDELKILDYNRVVADLNGLTEEDFLARIEENFTVEPLPEMTGEDEASLAAFRPAEKHTFSMYLGGKWYRLTAKEGSYDPEDVVGRLDVSILQNKLLAPILSIGDPRVDSRISFIGGIRGLAELVRLVKEGAAVAFAMYPTTLDDLMDIADAGAIMPPKSTWFEPKLRSGLFIHPLS